MIFIVIFQDMAIILLTMMGGKTINSVWLILISGMWPSGEKVMTSSCIKLKVMFFPLVIKMVLHSGTGLKKSQVISLITR